jgi:hypothetical protein
VNAAPCLKRKYGSEQSARKKLRELRKKRRMHRAEKVENHAYRCLFCHAWHLTSQAVETHLDGSPA